MGRTARTYQKVDEADQLIADLCAKHGDVFWSVNPQTVVIMGIDNVARTEKAVEKDPLWSKFRNIKGVEKAIFAANQIPVRYIIEVYWSDWNTWNTNTRLAIIARHLLEITPDVEKKNRPDAVGFKILYDVLGINWESNYKQIPSLRDDDIEFNLDLRPGLDDISEDDEIAEVVEEVKKEEEALDLSDEDVL